MPPRPTRRALLPGLALLLAGAADPPPPPVSLPAVTLAELMAATARVPSRRAAFREEKRLAALTVPLHSTGRLVHRRPGHLEKLTEAPMAESLVVDGGRLTLEMANAVPQVIDLDSQPELRLLVDALRGPLDGDLAALQRGFSVAIQGSMAAWRLDLTPADPRAARLLRVVRISGSGTDLREVLAIQANGDESYMEIEPLP